MGKLCRVIPVKKFHLIISVSVSVAIVLLATKVMAILSILFSILCDRKRVNHLFLLLVWAKNAVGDIFRNF